MSNKSVSKDINNSKKSKYDIKARDLSEEASVNADNNAMVKGIFLLILAVSGNYVAETIGCQTARSLTSNMISKHAIILMMIYFTVNFTATDSPNPYDSFKRSILIWIVYLMFSKMHAPFALACIFILMAYYVMSNYTEHYKKEYVEIIDEAKTEKEKDKLYNEFIDLESNIITWQEYALYALIITIVVGFSYYSYRKYKEHKGDFSMYKYVFGVPRCRTMQNKWREKMEEMGFMLSDSVIES
jgi:hypothetical protein